MANTLSAGDYEQLARRYYDEKQYEKAIEAFTIAINASVIPNIALYHGRASSYGKLGKYNAGIQDGRHMVQNYKTDSVGYLRTASLLKKKNALQKALDVYKLGMKKVPVNDKNYESLQQLHNSLTCQLSPPKAVDPFIVLPAELVDMVFRYLRFKTMVNCLRVSKAWKNYLTGRAALWKDLDLSEACRNVNRKFVSNAVRNAIYTGNGSKNLIDRVVIHRFPHPDMLRNIATACTGLCEIEFLSGDLMGDTLIEMAQCARNLKKVTLHVKVSIDTVSQILRFRPEIEHAEFRWVHLGPFLQSSDWKGSLPNLHTLVLDQNECDADRVIYTSAIHIQNLFPENPVMPNLQCLRLTNWSYDLEGKEFSTIPLTHLVLDRVMRMCWFPWLPSTLKHLTINTTRPFATPKGLFGHGGVLSKSWINAERADLRGLTHLQLSGFEDMTPEFLKALLDTRIDEDTGQALNSTTDPNYKCSYLRHFSFKGCTTDQNCSLVGSNGLLTASPRIITPALESLTLSSFPLTDDDLLSLLARCGDLNLHTADISQTYVTSYGARILIDSSPTLGFLNLDGCRAIKSRDIVKYAKSLGLEVSMQMNTGGIGHGDHGGRRGRRGRNVWLTS